MSLKEYVRKNANVPNLLTLIRLLLIPVYIILFISGEKNTAMIVFLSACFTDMLDGFLARRLGQITNFGKLMDPFADKAMVITAMLSMAIGNARIPAVIPWPAVAILLTKEAVMVIGGLIMLRLGFVVFSHMIGKIAHSVFVGALVSSFFHEDWLVLCKNWPAPLDMILIWVAVAFTLCALAFYVKNSIQTWNNAKASRVSAQAPAGQDKAG